MAFLPRSGDVVVQVVPSPERFVQSRWVGNRERVYKALIYTELPEFTPGGEAPPGQPQEIAGLPLAAVEEITVNWGLYEEYLAAFLAGEKVADHMRHKLFRILSSGLERLLDDTFPRTDGLRVWWSCTEAPELVDLPWELVARRSRGQGQHFSFVRGLPPKTPPPVIPVGDTLKLAVIADGPSEFSPFLSILRGLFGIEVIVIEEEPRRAIHKAVESGVELLHFVVDGVVTLAREGVLYFHGRHRPELPAYELASLLSGSRVGLVGLSSTASTNPDLMEVGPTANQDMMGVGRRSVPSAYRAFAHLGVSRFELPSVLAPLGPIDWSRLSDFWTDFYRSLTHSLSLEAAITEAWDRLGPLPMALFLRHPQRRLFRRGARDFRSLPNSMRLAREVSPSQADGELRVSRSLVTQLSSLAERGVQLGSAVSRFLEEEQAHQDQLNAALDDWQAEEGVEP